MAFTPGHRKAGGRKKGTPNRPRITARERADAMGVDPIEILLMFAAGDWKGLGYQEAFTTKYSPAGIEFTEDTIPQAMRMKAAAEAAQYIEPKLKSVEHSGAIASPDHSAAVKELTAELIRITEEK